MTMKTVSSISILFLALVCFGLLIYGNYGKQAQAVQEQPTKYIMTRREVFCAYALQGIVTSYAEQQLRYESPFPYNLQRSRQLVTQAISLADEMERQLDKGE